MPTCPSCTSITLAADPANTFCTSLFTVTVDCASNPFLQARSRVEYSSDNGVLDPWKPVKKIFINKQFYPLFLNSLGPADLYDPSFELISPGNIDDQTTQTYNILHDCANPTLFQEYGDGYYRVGFEISYLAGTTCIQNSNSIQIDLNTTVAAGKIIDAASANGCVCNSTDPTHGASAELAINWSSTTSTCTTSCIFEYNPTFILENNGDVNYTLPETIGDRTVKLFNVGAIGDATPDGFAVSKNTMYFKSETTNYLTEVVYQWPTMLEPLHPYKGSVGAYAAKFRVGHFVYDTETWQSGAYLEDPSATLLSIPYRQRKIWTNGSNLLPNYTLFDAANDSSGYKSMGYIDYAALSDLLILNPNSYSSSPTLSYYNQDNFVNNSVSNCADPTFLGANPLGCAYANIYTCNLGEGGEGVSDLAFILAADYNAGDSSGDLSGSVLVNLNPHCYRSEFVMWGAAYDFNTGGTTGNGRQGYGLLGQQERLGSAVAYARNTDTIIIGSPYAHNGGVADTGKVEVYTHDNTSVGQASNWEPKGSFIYSSNTNGHSGGSVAISADGDIIAVGQNDGLNVGHKDVRVKEWNGSAWTNKGFDIGSGDTGVGTTALALSDDGLTLIVGKAGDAGGGTAKGSVYVYAWSGSAWVQKGSTINGTSDNDFLGGSVDISSDGDFIAMTASNNSNYTSTYSWSGSAWVLYATIASAPSINSNLTNFEGEYIFTSVSLSKTGNRISIGFPSHNGASNTVNQSGLVRVYKQDSGSWLQVGADILGPVVAEAYFGTSVALDDTGYIVTASCPGQSVTYFSTVYPDVGRVHQYTFNETSWIPKYGMDNEEPTLSKGWSLGNVGSGSNINFNGRDSRHGSTTNGIAVKGNGRAIIVGSPSFGNTHNSFSGDTDGGWNVIYYCTKDYICSNFTMENPNELTKEEMAPGWLYPEIGIYDAPRSNPGNLPALNSEVGITSGFDYKTYPTTDIATLSANFHFTAYSFDAGSQVLNTGTANQPCTGLADCPPFYHSTDVGARSNNTGLLSIINKIEFVSAITLENTYTPTNATAVKIKNSDGTDNISASSGEGWYHVKAKEVSAPIYNTWNSANSQTPTNSINSTKQHWAGTPAGMNFHTRFSNPSFDAGRYGTLESTIFELYFRSGAIGSSTKTMRYAFDPFTLEADYGILPHEVDEAGEAGLFTTDSSSLSIPAILSCSDSSAANFFPDIHPATPWGYGLTSRKLFHCVYCDSQSGNTESSNADDGAAGDIEESFEHVSISLTHPTYQNWGDGAVTHTVNRMPLFSSIFPSPLLDYRYKAVLYKVDQPTDSWNHPNSYIVAGGIQDMLATPTVTFSSNTYPAPLLLPEGNYSIKWSINVLTTGVYEIEECWWEYPFTLAALNVRPNPPIFAQISTHPQLFSFTIQVQDTSRSTLTTGPWPFSTTPIHAPSSPSFCQGWEGVCIDVAGTLNGIPGENITLYDPATNEPNSGFPKYTTPEACIGGGFTWEGFDRIANVEDVTTVPYSNAALNNVFTNSSPILSASNGGSSFSNHQNWKSFYMPLNWLVQPSGSIFPSEQLTIKVTWESGWTKEFIVTTPVIYNRSDNSTLNGWWDHDGVFPCNAELFDVSQNLYNEPQLYQFPYNQTGTSAGNNRSYGWATNQLLVGQPGSPPLPPSPIYGQKTRISYHQIHEDTCTPAPTYPLPMYEGVDDPYYASLTNNSPHAYRWSLGSTQAIQFGMNMSAIEYGSSIFHANDIMGGFTGELVMRQADLNLASSWSDVNTGLLPTKVGTRSTLGTSHAIYDNLISDMLAGTGAVGNNTTPVNVGKAGTLTEAAYSEILFAETQIYAKDCPVCLPPTVDKACRYRANSLTTNAIPWQLPVGGSGVSVVITSVNFKNNNPYPNTEAYDDGSCFICDLGTGKLKVDGWDSIDSNPPHYEWYNTNDAPLGNSGGGHGAADYQTGTIVEGTGNILSQFNGINLVGSVTGNINEADSTFTVGGVPYDFYKVEMAAPGACATEGYADDSTSKGKISFIPTVWGDFLQAVSVNINLADVGIIVDLLYWNGASWDVIAHNVYNSGTTPTFINGVLTGGYINPATGASQTITYGHYKIRVRLYDTTQAWTGAQPISWCFQEVPLNFRVLACDSGGGNYITSDGVLITDANLVHIDNTCIESCTCCPQVTASVQTGGTACAATQTIVANYNCTLAQQVTQLDMVLWYISPSGVTSFVGNFPTVTGSITSGTQAFGSVISGQAAIDGGQYFILTTYTNTNGATCPDTTGPALTVNPLPTCDCQDPTALNYLTVYPGGNADCAGLIGGTNYSCCTYPTYCGTPTITVTEAACQIEISATTACTLGALPDTVTLQFFDVSTTGNVWDPNNQYSTFAMGIYNPSTTAPPYVLTTSDDCSGMGGVTLLGGAGTYVVKQIQTWANGYVLETISAPATITTTHYPIICGCTNPLASNYNAAATCDDGSCSLVGCMDGGATGYTSTLGFGSFDDGITATNYNPNATSDNGSCLYEPICEPFHVSSRWVRPNCSTGWCDPEIQFGWASCDLDILGNIIETPNNITILTGFSTDNGTTWTDSVTGTLWDQPNANSWGNTASLTVLQIFTQWAAEGLIGTSDQFECIIRWRIKADYPTAATYYSTYKTFKIMNPHINAFGWATSNGFPNGGDNDVPNLSAGQQVNCHAAGLHPLFDSPTQVNPIPHSPGLGQDTIIIIAPCGCTDDGNNTLANTWTIPTVATYNSPNPGIAANNLMASPSTGVDDGSCQYAGCMDPTADNYDSNATADCLSLSPMPSPACDTPSATCCCIYGGCTDPCATNYDATATSDDGSCVIPQIVINASWIGSGCFGNTYSVNLRDIDPLNWVAGISWGFTQVNWTLHFDPTGANTLISTGTEMVNLGVDSNYVGWTYDEDCSTPSPFTSGVGAYRITGTAIYPGGTPLCDQTYVHDFVVTANHFTVCDCLACPTCTNYNSLADCDDGSCSGCTDPLSGNYNPGAVVDDGSCLYYGCTDATAANYDFPADATHIDDGSCLHWHIWQACGTSDQTSFGGGAGSGPVSLADNQVGITTINPLQTAGEVFSHQWWDGSAWVSEYCWEYIGTATGNNPASYTNPLNTTSAPSQWQSTTPNTTYATCLACTPVLGCTDPLATNYNPLATIDDGSCLYPCCDVPTLTQAAGHVDDCDVEYEMAINCNNPATDNADTITTVLEFWDGAAWQTANSNVHNPVGTDNITSHSGTFHYNCSADDFGGYGSGQYRITSTITYSNGHTCTQVSNTETINMGIPGCLDPTATNYNPAATCQCVTCLFTHCCDTPVLTLDLTNGICDQSLEVTVNCTPIADDGYTALWQSFATGAWVTIQTDTSTAATGAVTLTLPNALLHTASGTSENYRVVFTSDYTAPTPDCTVTSNVLTVTAPILGCMDGGATEYTVVGAPPNATGFGTAGDGLTASNYNPAAQCDDGSCCIDGCTDVNANNYNPLATCDDGSCSYTCCGIGTIALDTTTYGVCYEAINWTSDFSGCPTTPTSILIDLYDPSGALIDTNTYAAPVTGTVYHWSNSFLDSASANNSGSFTVTVTYSFLAPTPDCTTSSSVIVTFPILGCMDPLSGNYNPLATCDDGSCYYIDACTDGTALNFNPFAVNDDGSCIYCGEGCTDPSGSPSNYSASFICDCDYTWLGMGTCSIATWFDEPSCTTHGTCSIGSWITEADCCTNNSGTWSGTACSGGAATYTAGVWTNTYAGNQQVSWNSCCATCSYGCTDPAYSNYDPTATCDCTDTLGTEPCNSTTAALTGANCCCTNCIYGCTDDGGFNQAWWDGTNGASFDYATDTGYTLYNDMLILNAAGANNYNSLATCEDGSCTYNGCTDPLATNYNANLTADCAGLVGGTDYSCCIYPTTGCTDVGTPALNVTPGATVDDGSCMYCDATTGNYENSGLVDQAPWATSISINSPTSDAATNDGSLFASFTLTASGLLLQALAEFQNGTNDWAIELYQVPTNGGASGTGTLVATAAQATTTTGTVWSHTFLNLPYGYYAIRLVTINSAGVVEPTQCFIEFNDIVQATVCNDPTASNYPPPVPADLRFTDNTLCIYPGYCACAASTSVVPGPPCSGIATIHATISCVTGTDVTWYWQDGSGTTVLSGTTANISAMQLVSSLTITANGTYTFNWLETSTPYATCPLQTETIVTSSIITCGCTDPTMSNYSISNTHDCNGDPLGTQLPGWNASPCCTMCVWGCTDSTALNYSALATCDDGTCIYPGDGCCDPLASNFNSAATNCIPALCEYCND